MVEYSCVGRVKWSFDGWIVMVECSGDESSCDGGVELGGVVMVEWCNQAEFGGA